MKDYTFQLLLSDDCALFFTQKYKFVIFRGANK